jgi:hypothetical protein
MRRSVPASTARDALTHITGRNEASGAIQGKRAEAGVIHRGRNGLASSGSAYDESCARTGREATGTEACGRHVTYCESCGPDVDPRCYLCVFVRADCPGWCMQVKIRVRRRNVNVNVRRRR